MSETVSSNIQQLFLRLLPERSLVKAERLAELLAGAVDPVTLASSQQYSYSEKQMDLLLTLAERQQQAITALPSFTRAYWWSNGGGPGGGKTTDQLRCVAREYGVKIEKTAWGMANLSPVVKKVFRKAAAFYVAPDRKGLAEIGEALGAVFDQSLYLSWRAGSNFECNVGMSRSFATGKNIVHDTTLGSDYALHNLRAAMASGRYVAVRITGAPLETRAAAVDARNAVYFQSLPRNFEAQDRQFGENLPAIPQTAHEVGISWRNYPGEPARLVALIKENAVISVRNTKGFEKFMRLYPAAEVFETRMTHRSAKAVASEMPKIIAAQREELRHVRKPGGNML